MARLWDKGEKATDVSRAVAEFTVGNDYLYDRRLVIADCAASVAHARQLERLQILNESERRALETELHRIAEEAVTGRFVVAAADEDCHTAIENRLTERLDDPGRRIHAGRSRNDQSATALRLWLREGVLLLLSQIEGLAETMAQRAEEHRFLPMVGRTHMQPAMPSSVGLWFSAFAEELVDDARLLLLAYDQIDRSPLGAGASYGVPLPLDREYTAELMGFRSVHRNVLASQNARGKIESLALDAFDHTMITLSRFAADVIVFSLNELGCFRLPTTLATGSSIMPQKRNPDILELIRSKAAVVAGRAQSAKAVIRSLNSGYSRDLQETKALLMDAFDATLSSISAAHLVARHLEVDQQALMASFDQEVLATDEVFILVKKGTPFRDAYRKVAGRPSTGDIAIKPTVESVMQLLKDRTSTGTPGNLRIDELRGEIKDLGVTVRKGLERHQNAIGELLGSSFSLLAQGHAAKGGVEDKAGKG